jgi:glycosyltransferase involved in cell wall biosynthesis
MAQQVADLIRRHAFDLVHVEQLQALTAAAPALRAGLPWVLRAQNVESAVWDAAPVVSTDQLRARLRRLEARRLRRFEADAVAAADLTIALSPADAAQLSGFAPGANVVVIPPPFALEPPARVPHAPESRSVKDFVWIGSPGWAPNEDGVRWLIESIWPAISARVPGARLHVYGGRARSRNDAIAWHDSPGASSDAFRSGTVLLLPLRIAAGVRMRLLEAWARGVPVIASPAAIEGLDAADGRDVLVASGPEEFARAAARLSADAHLREDLAAAGRATLARRHDPSAIARATLDAYREALSRHAGRMRTRPAPLAGACGAPP